MTHTLIRASWYLLLLTSWIFVFGHAFGQAPSSCLFSTPEIGLIIWLGSSFNDQSFGSPRSVKVRTLFVTVPALACSDLHAPQDAFPSNR